MNVWQVVSKASGGASCLTVSKRFILATVLVLGFSLIIVLGPVIRCAYKQYLFENYIRVLVELPSCEDPISGATGRSCRYLF